MTDYDLYAADSTGAKGFKTRVEAESRRGKN
jgi:hypothetical protein